MTDPTVIDLLSDVDAYLCALHVHGARHDQIGADLTCGGCVLRDRIAAALPVLAGPAPVPPPAGRAAYAQGIRDAIAELERDAFGAIPRLRRLAAEAQPTTKPDIETLAAMFEGLGRLLATSSRDWGQYAPDAWLYAVVLGWDREEAEHDETCTHGAMEEMQQRHGWSDEAVAKARRYRAAVRALTATAAGVRQDGAQP